MLNFSSICKKLTTPDDKLRRMLEGFYVQLKTVRIKNSKEARESSLKLRKRFRFLTIHLLNSKDKDLSIAHEDFNQVWYADKYHVADCCMLLQRAKEEVEQTKIEMNRIRFLTVKRSSLKQSTPSEEADEIFCKGKAVMAYSEIERLSLQIQISLKMFNFNCSNEFLNFVSETYSNSDTELLKKILKKSVFSTVLFDMFFEFDFIVQQIIRRPILSAMTVFCYCAKYE
ncbi:hypothetical protein GHT06_006130 [Daphnia sinensis]|uniref:Uncharacterized protein n=1 Tax=Daphnia sinensis TaxID=1820382 RepID=A0AAD5KVM1_9CRUS|nr:hypothetical protein GHT06_006130 [Daphnia sinensis]